MRRFTALLAVLCLVTPFTFSACARNKTDEESLLTPQTTTEATHTLPENIEEVVETEQTLPEENGEELVETEQALPKKYFRVDGSDVNIRGGAGTEYARLGVAGKDTLYSLEGSVNGWFKTLYKDREAYVCADYCTAVDMDICADERVEKVIEEGCRYMGVKYVYGAVRYHDGTGRLLSGFTPEEFDCSSLMQYIFKTGAGYNLQVNTRTQIFQGRTVTYGEIERGDLLFFTNSSRVNRTGIERVGHVALYLGGGYILHTASDYANIERISKARREYFIQAQRIFE